MKKKKTYARDFLDKYFAIKEGSLLHYYPPYGNTEYMGIVLSKSLLNCTYVTAVVKWFNDSEDYIGPFLFLETAMDYVEVYNET